jgi:hypothetical protein
MKEKEKIKQIPKILVKLEEGEKKEFLQVKIFSHATCDAVTKLQVRSVWKRDIKIFLSVQEGASIIQVKKYQRSHQLL